MRSKYNKINLKDIIYGGIITAGTAFVGFLIDFLNVFVSGGALDFKRLTVYFVAAVVAGLVYVLKQLKSNSEGVLFKKEE